MGKVGLETKGRAALGYCTSLTFCMLFLTLHGVSPFLMAAEQTISQVSEVYTTGKVSEQLSLQILPSIMRLC